MIVALVVGSGIFLLVAAVFSSRSTKKKKDAAANLQREVDSISTISILDLVEAEVTDLGLKDIAGAEGITAEVLLKVWKSNHEVVAGCNDKASLRYVLADDVVAANANEDDVTLECA